MLLPGFSFLPLGTALWKEHPSGELHLLLCCPRSVTMTTHLLSWEVPASPGKPPPPTLPGHLLLLQLVHSTLWADEGHGFFLHRQNLPYIALGAP